MIPAESAGAHAAPSAGRGPNANRQLPAVGFFVVFGLQPEIAGACHPGCRRSGPEPRQVWQRRLDYGAARGRLTRAESACYYWKFLRSCRYRLGVRTRGSQPRDRGSNPRTGTKFVGSPGVPSTARRGTAHRQNRSTRSNGVNRIAPVKVSRRSSKRCAPMPRVTRVRGCEQNSPMSSAKSSG
jgi:hypothetical protein